MDAANCWCVDERSAQLDSLMIPEISAYGVNISETSKACDMSDRSAFALDCWFLLPFNLLKIYRLRPLIPNFSHSIKGSIYDNFKVFSKKPIHYKESN